MRTLMTLSAGSVISQAEEAVESFLPLAELYKLLRRAICYAAQTPDKKRPAMMDA
jgi:hypothetical protein